MQAASAYFFRRNIGNIVNDGSNALNFSNQYAEKGNADVNVPFFFGIYCIQRAVLTGLAPFAVDPNAFGENPFSISDLTPVLWQGASPYEPFCGSPRSYE